MNQTADPTAAATVAEVATPDAVTPASVIIASDLVPIALFLAVATVVIVAYFFRFARRREAEKTIRAAIERGQPLDLQVIEKLIGPEQPAHYSLLVRGIILVAAGIGLAGMRFINLGQGIDTQRGLLAAGELVGVVGIGILLAARLTKPTKP